jgi:hypothetical protein
LNRLVSIPSRYSFTQHAQLPDSPAKACGGVFQSRPGRLAARPPAWASGNGPIARPATGCWELGRRGQGSTRRVRSSLESRGDILVRAPPRRHQRRYGGLRNRPGEKLREDRVTAGARHEGDRPSMSVAGTGPRVTIRVTIPMRIASQPVSWCRRSRRIFDGCVTGRPLQENKGFGALAVTLSRSCPFS